MNIELYTEEKKREFINNSHYSILCDIVLSAGGDEIARVHDAVLYTCRRWDSGEFTPEEMRASIQKNVFESIYVVSCDIVDNSIVEDTLQKQSEWLLDPQMVDALTDEFYDQHGDEYKEFTEFFETPATGETK